MLSRRSCDDLTSDTGPGSFVGVRMNYSCVFYLFFLNEGPGCARVAFNNCHFSAVRWVLRRGQACLLSVSTATGSHAADCRCDGEFRRLIRYRPLTVAPPDPPSTHTHTSLPGALAAGDPAGRVCEERTRRGPFGSESPELRLSRHPRRGSPPSHPPFHEPVLPLTPVTIMGSTRGRLP